MDVCREDSRTESRESAELEREKWRGGGRRTERGIDKEREREREKVRVREKEQARERER